MIAFDNGPADGDYARYIDTLVKGSVSTSASTLGSNGMVPDAQSMTVATDGRLESDATMRTHGLDATPRRAAPTTPLIASLANQGTRTVRAIAPVNAGATDRVDVPVLLKAVLTIVAGLLLAIVGVVGHPLSVLMIVGGIAIIVAGIGSVARSVATSAAKMARTKRAS